MTSFTQNNLRRLGRNLRDCDTPSANDLAQLQAYRLYHKDIAKRVFDILCEKATEINEEAICAFRIKRIDSIIRKLQRLKGKVELKSMRDIAGCRCILRNDAETFKLMKALKDTPLILAQDPNIYMGQNKKKSGYGSIHMYVTLPEYDGLFVEIQIRSIEQHDWATFVETVDLMYHTKVKEDLVTTTQEQYDDFCRMHRIMSVSESHRTPLEVEMLLKTIVKYDLFGKMDEVFVSNITRVRQQWIDTMSNTTNPHYFYISTDEENRPTIKAYTSYSEAERFYFDAFEQSSNRNQVLVCMNNPTYETICTAYSNYVLVYRRFIHSMHQMFVDSIDKGVLTDFKSTIECGVYYITNTNKIMNTLRVEFSHIRECSDRYDSEALLPLMQDTGKSLLTSYLDFRNVIVASLSFICIGNSKGLARVIRRVLFGIVKFAISSYVWIRTGKKGAIRTKQMKRIVAEFDKQSNAHI